MRNAENRQWVICGISIIIISILKNSDKLMCFNQKFQHSTTENK